MRETDNFRPGQPRPFGVGALEQTVRRGLAQVAEAVPAMRGDLAGRAIAQVRRIRRWQTVGGVLTVAVATLVAGGGAAALRDHSTGTLAISPGLLDTPESATPTGEPDLVAEGVIPSLAPMAAVRQPVDVLAGKTLFTVTGARIDVTAVGEVSAGYRTDGGWLLVGGTVTPTSPPPGGAAVRQSLWYASASGAPRLLRDGVQGVVVDPTGSRVAWRDTTQLTSVPVADGVLGQPVRTKVAADVVPVGFLGRAVRLARNQTGVGLVGQDLWDPAAGTYAPAWNNDAAAVYGVLPGGHSLVGQVIANSASKERCLALLSADHLKATKTACGLRLTPQARGWVSPGGRWLVAEAGTGGNAESVLIDLSTVFAGPPHVVSVDVSPTGAAAWEDADTMVRGIGGVLHRLRLDVLWDGANGIDEIAVAGVRTDAKLLVLARPTG
ncbi:MAG TPA: hypothetical protein VFE14_12805 [Micromonosporaceae bacterium]|nr:hypothetical protein [Micromonosporaceae bacterium]